MSRPYNVFLTDLVAAVVCVKAPLDGSAAVSVRAEEDFISCHGVSHPAECFAKVCFTFCR